MHWDSSDRRSACVHELYAPHHRSTEGQQPACGDEKFVAVNQRGQATRSRGMVLRLQSRDAGFDFSLEPGQLADGNPVETLCGSISGAADWVDGGWIAQTISVP